MYNVHLPIMLESERKARKGESDHAAKQRTEDGSFYLEQQVGHTFDHVTHREVERCCKHRLDYF